MRSALALAGLALIAAGLPLTPSPALAAETCQEKLVTISASNGDTVEGTDGDDVILATDGDVSIDARGGDDTICLVDGDAVGGPGRDSVQVVDGPAAQHLVVNGIEDLDVTLGEGGDTLLLTATRGGLGTVRMTSGSVLTLDGRYRAALDLADDLLELDGGTYSVVGSPAIRAGGRKVYLEGDAGDNRLSVLHNACRVTVRGRDGDDRIDLTGVDLPTLDCHPTTPQLFGQGGDDVLRGRARADLLVGGSGRDAAYGRAGRDTCRAETRRGCER